MNIIKKVILSSIDSLYIFKFENGVSSILMLNLENYIETVLAVWKCAYYNFKNTNILVYDNIFLAVVQEETELVIRKVSKDEKRIIFEKRYNIRGNKLDYSRVFRVDENNIIICLEESETFSYDSFLCDLSEDKSYFINDRRMADAYKSDFKLYTSGNQAYICFAEVYMEDWEKEELYMGVKSREIVVSDCFESLNIIKVKDFITAVKSDLEIIPFTIIDTISISGWIRYIGMNESYIYYRVKNFETRSEKLYSVNKLNLKKRAVAKFNS